RLLTRRSCQSSLSPHLPACWCAHAKPHRNKFTAAMSRFRCAKCTSLLEIQCSSDSPLAKGLCPFESGRTVSGQGHALALSSRVTLPPAPLAAPSERRPWVLLFVA